MEQQREVKGINQFEIIQKYEAKLKKLEKELKDKQIVINGLVARVNRDAHLLGRKKVFNKG